MEFFDSLIFLLILMIFLLAIKADFIFLIFGAVVLLYFILELASINTLDIFFSIIDYMIVNPFWILILIVPVIIYGISILIRRYKVIKKE